MSDSLFRISLKAYIENDKGEVLVVKEMGREWWDLPGGGMDYEEDFEAALRRELEEEVGYTGKFSSDEIQFVNPEMFKDSESGSERLVCYYNKKLKGDMSYEPNFPLKETEKGW